MMKRPVVVYAAVSVAAGLLGGLIAGVFVVWINVTPGEWLGFLGSLIGAAATIYAGYLAFKISVEGLGVQKGEIEKLKADSHDRTKATLQILWQRCQQARGQAFFHLPKEGEDTPVNAILDIDYITREALEVWRLPAELIRHVQRAENAISIWNYNARMRRCSYNQDKPIPYEFVEADVRRVMRRLNGLEEKLRQYELKMSGGTE